MSSHDSGDETLQPGQAERLDSLCDRFEAAWQSGARPRLEEFLPLVDEADRPALLRELLALEVDYRRRHGERPTAEEYRLRLPAYDALVADALAIQTAGDSVNALPRMPDIPGYEIVSEVGRGGMGLVYRARHLRLNRVVALKMILGGAQARPEDLVRFLGEAESIASLKHPHIVPIYEIGQHDGQPYFTMEFVDGGTLLADLAGTPQPARRAAELVETLALATHHAHQHGIVHRDLKPGNVLLTADGTPKITDFSLAKRLEGGAGLTQTGSVIGTPSYMAPEQAQGRHRDVGPATDVYALGAILYEMLTGRPPFKGQTSYDTIMQVLTVDPVPPTRLQPKVPRDLETICLKSLAKDSRKRYPSAAVLADDLRRFLNGEPILARPVGRLERLAKWARRRPAAAITAGLGLLMAMSLLGLDLWFTSQLRGERDRADEARRDADTRADAEQEANKLAQRQTRRAEELLADMHTAQGLMAGGIGESAQGLLWFANAAFLSGGDADREWANRVRVRTWSRKAFLPVRALPHPNQHVCLVAFHPHSWHLLTVCREQRCIVWDLESESPLSWSKGEQPVGAACWSPDGRLLALGLPRGEVELRSFPDGEVLRRLLLRGPVTALAFSRDGRYLAMGGSAVRVWDVRGGTFATPELPHPMRVDSVSFNTRGDRLATGCQDSKARVFAVPGESSDPLFPPVPHAPFVAGGFDQRHFHIDPGPVFSGATEQLVTLRNGQPVRLNERGEPVKTFAVTSVRGFVPSPTGRYLLLPSYRSAHLCKVAEDEVVSNVVELRHGLNAAVFSPDEKTLFTACNDRTCRLWSLPGGEPSSEFLAHQGPASHAAYSLDGGFVATCQSDGLVRVWRLPAANPRDRHPATAPESPRVRLSPDGKWVTALGVSNWWWKNTHRRCRVLETKTGQAVGPDLLVAGFLVDVAFAANGNALATVSRDNQGGQGPAGGSLEFWEVGTGKRLGEEVPLPAAPRAVAYDPKSSRVAVLCDEGHILVAEPERERVLWHLRHECQTPTYPAVPFVAFTPEGLVTVGPDSSLAVHDLTTGRLRYLVRPNLAPELGFNCAALSADRRVLATGAASGVLQFWDLAAGRPVGEALRHSDWVMGVKFGPGGLVATACRDGMGRLWDRTSGRLVCPPFKHGGEVLGIDLTPDGRSVLTTSQTVRVWEARTGKPLSPLLPSPGNPGTIAVTPDGRTAVVGSHQRPNLHLLDLGDLSGPDDLSLEDLRILGEVASGFRSFEGDLVNLSGEEWLERWNSLRRRQPGYGSLTVAGVWDRVRGFALHGRWDEAAAVLPKEPETGAGAPESLRLMGEVIHHQAARLRREGEKKEAERDQQRAWACYERLLALCPVDPGYAAEFAAKLLESQDAWVILNPEKLASAGGVTLTRQEDGSVLASGALPDRDTYTIRAMPKLRGITAVRLEVLPHPSLPGDGPGRPPGGSFSLTEIRLSAASIDDPDATRPVRFQGAVGTYVRPPDEHTTRRDGPQGVIDGDHGTRWDVWPQMGRANAAYFETEHPVAHPGGTALTVHLDFQDPRWVRHLLGRFRLAVTKRAEPLRHERWRLFVTNAESLNGWTKLGAAYLLVGEPARAVGVLERALARTSGGGAADWLILALAHKKAGNREEARRWYDRALSLMRGTESGEEVHFLGREAMVEVLGLEWEEAVKRLHQVTSEGSLAQLSRAIERRPDDAAPWRRRAEWYVHREQWQEAAADLIRAAALQPEDHFNWFHAAPLLLRAGDTLGYHRHRREMLRRFGNTSDASITERVVRSSLLLPVSPEDVEVPSSMAERALAREDIAAVLPDVQLARGQVDYRRGEFEAASRMLRKVVDARRYWNIQVPAQLLLAMAEYQLGRTEQAQSVLHQANILLDNQVPDIQTAGIYWNDWLMAQILRREAGGLIGKATEEKAPADKEAAKK